MELHWKGWPKVSVHGLYSPRFYKYEHLRFRQRISTVLLDWVLRCENEERLVQLSRRAHDGDAVFLHGFEKRRLRFWRSTVDFVREDYI